MIEWSTIAAGASVCAMAIAFATFWVKFGGRLARAEADAKAAQKTADVAVDAAKEANEKVVVLSAAFGLYREQVAKEYIHREAMREVEDRLTSAIERLGDRLDRFFETQTQRK